MKSNLVIYHKNCRSKDGFAAAFAAWLKFGDTAEYLAADYNDPVPDVTGRDVHILDLSFPEEVLREMSRQANSLTLLDHHLTAQEKLSAFKPMCCGKIHFDLTQCGSMLAWKHFHPDVDVPMLFRWIQARDLWTWDVPDAKAFLSWLDTQPLDFQTWTGILEMTTEETEAVIRIGASLAEQFDGLCRSIAKQALPVVIAGEHGLMVNASGDFRSEVGSLLANQSGSFGLVWRTVEDGKVLCSLRSVRTYDVEQLASRFGGGGHVNAASFTLPVDKLTELALGRVAAPSA